MCFFSPLQFSGSDVSDSLKPHGLQHTRPPCHHQLLEFTQTHVHWVSDAIQPSHPLSSPSPPAFNLSQHRVFSNESFLPIRWPKYWSFSFSIRPSNEYLGKVNVLEALGEARWEVRRVIFRQQWSRSHLIGYLQYFCHPSSIPCQVGLTFWFQIPNPCLVFLCQYS